MPTYEYKCRNGHSFEKFFPQITDRRRERCPQCGASAERLISGGAGLVFKGSGFYVTDYKRSAEKPADEKLAEKKADEKKPDEKKAETKKKDSSDK